MMNEFNLFLVGDIFAGNMGYNIGFGVASEFKTHKGKKWENNLSNLLGNADLVFGNLESPLVYDEKFSDNSSYAGHSDFANILKNNKIDIVSIANNHILDHGLEGFNSTCKILDENNIKYVGKNMGRISNIEIKTINGISIGFAAFNGINGKDNPSIYSKLDVEMLKNTISEMSLLNLDYRIISLHWGHEYVHYPSYKQIILAHNIIDEGIDIIVGHHPHVVQPVELYKNGIIFYSLGNFIFDMLWSKKVKCSMVAKLFLNKKKSIRYEIVPTYISDDYIPIPIENRSSFEKLIKKNEKRLYSQLGPNINKRKKQYNRISIINRLWERILMKKYLILNWNKLLKETKKKLLLKLFPFLIGA